MAQPGVSVEDPILDQAALQPRTAVRVRTTRGLGGRLVGPALVHLALLAIVAFELMPFAWAFLTSIKRPIDAFSLPPVWQFTPTLQAYERLWVERDFGSYLTNTLLIAAVTVALSVLTGALAAYGLARYTRIGGLALLVAALVFRALPRMAVILPFYYIARITRLYDTQLLLIVVLVAVNQPFTIWLLRNFFASIPVELEEAAMVDGCTRLQALLRVVFPIVAPGLVTAAVFTFLLAYQEYLIPLVLTQSRAVTLSVFIAQFSTENLGDWPVIAAASASLALPIVAIALFGQRYLIAGLTAGAVKG